jgi:hypothetical protein
MIAAQPAENAQPSLRYRKARLRPSTHIRYQLDRENASKNS